MQPLQTVLQWKRHYLEYDQRPQNSAGIDVSPAYSWQVHQRCPVPALLLDTPVSMKWEENKERGQTCAKHWLSKVWGKYIEYNVIINTITIWILKVRQGNLDIKYLRGFFSDSVCIMMLNYKYRREKCDLSLYYGIFSLWMVFFFCAHLVSVVLLLMLMCSHLFLFYTTCSCSCKQCKTLHLVCTYQFSWIVCNTPIYKYSKQI